MQEMYSANSDKPMKLFSLDCILAAGYRTNSSKAITFHSWAIQVLKKYRLQITVVYFPKDN